MNGSDFKMLSALLYERSGLVVTPDKQYLLESRLMPVAKKWQLDSFPALLAALGRNPNIAMVADVVEAMTINETLFFRDSKPFETFRTEMLPKLAASRRHSNRIRIWSAACSSGQEPYSLAMSFLEEKHKYPQLSLEIIATDLSRTILEKARHGSYSQFEVQRGMPVQLMVKYFDKDDDKWQLKPAVRQMVQFREFNLMNDPGALGRFDIIFCRNVLIYFDPATKSRILERFSRIIAPDGYLCLGGSEAVIGISKAFTPAEGLRSVYITAAQALGSDTAQAV